MDHKTVGTKVGSVETPKAQDWHNVDSRQKNIHEQVAKQPLLPSKARMQSSMLHDLPKQARSQRNLDEWRKRDILRIVPENRAARDAMHSLLELKAIGKLSDHHSAYITKTGELPAMEAPGPMLREDGETEDESETISPDMCSGAQQVGYFRLGFDCPILHIGLIWTLGRGTHKADGGHRGVDILLAPPGSKLARPKDLAANHILLYMHDFSGAWMMIAGGDIIFEGEMLKARDERVICKNQTHLQVNEMTFCIRFPITTRDEELQYLACRRHMLEGRNEGAQYHIYWSAISGIPFDCDMHLPDIVFRHGVGAGAFGTCFEGFDPKTGELRVAKQLVIKDELARRRATPELIAMTQFASKIGIVPVTGTYNSVNGKENSQDSENCPLPMNVWIVMKKGVDFREVIWNSDSVRSWGRRLWLAQRLLLGLETIHSSGYMHRDITPQNILVFERPLNAGLCDFGKVCLKPEDNDYSLCHRDYLPPEITYGQYRTYNQSIDIYLLGQVFARTWFPSAYKTNQGTQLCLRETGDHQLISQTLHKMSSKVSLADLTMKMVAWEPEARPSATKSLLHPCFAFMEKPQEFQKPKKVGEKRPAP